MRIIVPYTRLHPATGRLLNKYAPSAERHRLGPQSDAYHDLLASMWTGRDDLLIIEQDIGIHASVIPSLMFCPEPWCAFPYLVAGKALTALGCVRFTASLQTAEPDLFDTIGLIANDGLPAKDWRRMDVRLAGTLTERGYATHVHTPPVTHYHRY
ncbi:MAG: hypothetical protein ACYCV4_02055 [Dermatophilaceae bacterium]